MRLVISVDDHSAQPFRAEKQCIDRYLQTRSRYADLQMDLGVASRKQLTVFIWHVHFGVEGSAGQVDGVRGSCHFGLKFLSGKLGELQVRAKSSMHGGGIYLRHTHIRTDGVCSGQHEHLLRGAAVTGVDQVAEVDIATGDHATERSVNAFEGFQFLEAPDIGLRRSDRGAPGGIVTDSVVYFLFGYAVSLDQLFVPCGGDARKIFIGLHGAEVGARLRKLLIDFRAFDFCEKIALLHMAADVVIPLFDVAGGARVDWRLNVGLQRGWQRQVFLRGLDCGMDDCDRRYSGLLRFLGQCVVLLAAL